MSEWRIQVLKKNDWVNGLVPLDKDDVYRMIEFYRAKGDTVRLLKFQDGDFEPCVIFKPYPKSDDKIREMRDE